MSMGQKSCSAAIHRQPESKAKASHIHAPRLDFIPERADRVTTTCHFDASAVLRYSDFLAFQEKYGLARQRIVETAHLPAILAQSIQEFRAKRAPVIRRVVCINPMRCREPFCLSDEHLVFPVVSHLNTRIHK